MKRLYVGWIVVIMLIAVGLLVAALTSEERKPDRLQQNLEQLSKQALAKEPAEEPEPGEGKVTQNLPRALRLHLPVVACFVVPQEEDEHEHGAAAEQRHAQEQAKQQAKLKAELAMLEGIAADYKGVVAVVLLVPQSSPATFARRHIDFMKERTTIILSADNRELWRHEGPITGQQIRAELAQLAIKPSEEGEKAKS